MEAETWGEHTISIICILDSVFTYKHRLFTQSTFQWSNVPSTTAAQHARARKLVKHTKTTICTITDINKLIVNLTDAHAEI